MIAVIQAGWPPTHKCGGLVHVGIDGRGLAQGKGRSGLAWWAVSLLLGPIATLLIVLLDPVKPQRFGPRRSPSGRAGQHAGPERASRALRSVSHAGVASGGLSNERRLHPPGANSGRCTRSKRPGSRAPAYDSTSRRIGQPGRESPSGPPVCQEEEKHRPPSSRCRSWGTTAVGEEESDHEHIHSEQHCIAQQFEDQQRAETADDTARRMTARPLRGASTPPSRTR